MVSADGKLPYAEKDRYLMAGTLSLGQIDIRKYWSSFSLGSRSPSYLAKDPRNSFFLSLGVWDPVIPGSLPWEDGGTWDARQGSGVGQCRGREKQASLQDKLNEPACEMCVPKCD